jgi:hypothetical protein
VRRAALEAERGKVRLGRMGGISIGLMAHELRVLLRELGSCKNDERTSLWPYDRTTTTNDPAPFLPIPTKQGFKQRCFSPKTA